MYRISTVQGRVETYLGELHYGHDLGNFEKRDCSNVQSASLVSEIHDHNSRNKSTAEAGLAAADLDKSSDKGQPSRRP